MSSMDDRNEDEMLAAELALRLLDGDELLSARERMKSDPEFARRVDAWNISLAAIADEVSPEQHSPTAKQSLIDRIFDRKATTPIWSRLAVWRGLSLASLTIATVLGLFLAGSLQQRPGGVPDTVQAAQIASESGDFRALVVLDRTANRLHLTLVTGNAPPGRVLQFWAHGPDQPAMSVGLIRNSPSAHFPVPDFLNLAQVPLTFGISEEPPGGSTTGRPSGRVFGTTDIGNQ